MGKLAKDFAFLFTFWIQLTCVKNSVLCSIDCMFHIKSHIWLFDIYVLTLDSICLPSILMACFLCNFPSCSKSVSNLSPHSWPMEFVVVLRNVSQVLWNLIYLRNIWKGFCSPQFTQEDKEEKQVNGYWNCPMENQNYSVFFIYLFFIVDSPRSPLCLLRE